MMNRRGFLASIGAGLITAAAVTRLATAKISPADQGLAEVFGKPSEPSDEWKAVFDSMEGDFDISNLRYYSFELEQNNEIWWSEESPADWGGDLRRSINEAAIEEMLVEIQKLPKPHFVKPTHFIYHPDQWRL